MKAIQLLAKFIKKNNNKTTHCVNEWLYGEDMEVYVRRSRRLFNNDSYDMCLDIANIHVYEKGQGIFTAFLEEAHYLNPWVVTFVENVLNPRLCDFLLRQGFICKEHSIPASFYKTKEHHESN